MRLADRLWLLTGLDVAACWKRGRELRMNQRHTLRAGTPLEGEAAPIAQASSRKILFQKDINPTKSIVMMMKYPYQLPVSVAVESAARDIKYTEPPSHRGMEMIPTNCPMSPFITTSSSRKDNHTAHLAYRHARGDWYTKHWRLVMGLESCPRRRVFV